jgi:two-component system, sensor histidine kinase and response regulator
MKGQIGLESELGKGSTFFFTARFGLAKERAGESAGASRTSGVENREATSMPPRPLHILLAEDSLMNQKLAIGLLKKKGHEVCVVKDGVEALAAYQRQPFDLILMDVQMPEMDGFEATAAIRSVEPQGAHIPIIAMTAHALKGDRELCLEAGMDAYIAKPIRADELFETIDKLAPRT